MLDTMTVFLLGFFKSQSVLFLFQILKCTKTFGFQSQADPMKRTKGTIFQWLTYNFLHKLIFIGMEQYQNVGSNVKTFFFKHSMFIIKLIRANSPPCLHLSLAPPGTFLPALCKVTPLMHTYFDNFTNMHDVASWVFTIYIPLIQLLSLKKGQVYKICIMWKQDHVDLEKNYPNVTWDILCPL